MADGVVARENASLTLDRCLLTDNPRAGVLLTDGASAAISGTASTGNGYGLVQQSGSSVKKDSNGWWDNVIANEVQGSNLSVPVAPQLAEE